MNGWVWRSSFGAGPRGGRRRVTHQAANAANGDRSPAGVLLVSRVFAREGSTSVRVELVPTGSLWAVACGYFDTLAEGRAQAEAWAERRGWRPAW